MELDERLLQLQNDLQSRIDGVNNSLADRFGLGADTPVSYCPECGARLEGDVNFCSNCGTRIGSADDSSMAENDGDEYYEDDDEEEDDDEYGNDEEDGKSSLYGILFTDVRVLAEKYGCTEEHVFSVFQKIVDEAAKYGMEWSLVNADDDVCDDIWYDYNAVLSDFFENNDVPRGIQTPVFIIGGHDVIPIPMVKDPFGSSDSGKIPCDMCYAFYGDFFEELFNGGDICFSEESIRNSVSRLPLEDGKLNTTIEDDILAYFKRCAEYYDSGIPVDSVMMTANVSWLPASKTMSEHLPLVQHANNEDMVFSNMYVSPPVAPDNDESQKPVVKTLHQVGMLLFNLHGTDCKGMSGFFSDEGEAFNIESLDHTGAKVFNTVACYGARYSGYGRDDSMLLTSIYDKEFLLYAGSLIPVPMTELTVPEGVEVHEGSGSEHLMPIFCMEQYSGIPMGEAMMKAKLEYFNTFRQLERDDFSLATVMMFSLYGNPMLTMKRNEKVLDSAVRLHVLPTLPKKSGKKNKHLQMKKTRQVWKAGDSSMLGEIRSAVDCGLSVLHEGIRQNLYDYLGLEPRWLDRIDSYEIPSGDGDVEKGFIYAYKDKSRAFDNKTWVETDLFGAVRRKYTVK